MRITICHFSAWPLVLLLAGCESRMESKPADMLATLSEADREALSPEVREVYDAMVDGTLAGAQAADYEEALIQADDPLVQTRTTTYGWTLTEDRGAEYSQRGEHYEGPPMMWVRVQNRYGQIIECGTAHPTW